MPTARHTTGLSSHTSLFPPSVSRASLTKRGNGGPPPIESAISGCNYGTSLSVRHFRAFCFPTLSGTSGRRTFAARSATPRSTMRSPGGSSGPALAASLEAMRAGLAGGPPDRVREVLGSPWYVVVSDNLTSVCFPDSQSLCQSRCARARTRRIDRAVCGATC